MRKRPQEICRSPAGLATPTGQASPLGRAPNARASGGQGVLRCAVSGLLLLTAVPAAAAVFTVGAPVGPSQCTHGTLQAAIAAAAASPGLDIIRVTRGTYPAQRLTVEDADDLAIEGGFLECATPVRVDHSVLDGQGATPAGPVIRHLGSGHLTLADLHLRNGAAFGAGPTSIPGGGGVSSTGAGGLTVYRSLIYGNRARAGGGLYASIGPGQIKNVTLAGVGFAGNQAEYSGGGLYVRRADVAITGEDISYFSGNHADGAGVDDGGGAIYAMDSMVTIDGKPPTNMPFMDGNWALSKGGAIHLTVTEPGWFALYARNRPGGDPLAFANNTAIQGGALYLQAVAVGGGGSAVATLDNAVVSGNRAREGSAFYVRAAGSAADFNSATLGLASSLSGWSAPACPASQRCNRVDGNVGEAGPTILLERDGSRARASFFMTRGHLVDNIAGAGGGGLVSAGGGVQIDNSVIAGNDAGNRALFESAGGHEIRLENSTIAGNTRVAPAAFRLTSFADSLRLHNSIVFQPGTPLLHAPAGSPRNLRNLLVGDGHGVADMVPLNVQLTSDPLFENPGQGNFRPRLGSQAINRWSPGGGVDVPTIDLLGAARPAPPNAPTPYDFGAYEYGAVVDPIFKSSFERK